MAAVWQGHRFPFSARIIGRHIATRLLADGEQVVDVPPKPSARARVFATGQGRKTDATDAHSVALVGTRMAGLRPLVNDERGRGRRRGAAIGCWALRRSS
jgi:hypothetical protein